MTFGKIFGDILEAYFQNAAEIMKKEENPEYLQNYLYELIDYYYKNFSEKRYYRIKQKINYFIQLFYY